VEQIDAAMNPNPRLNEKGGNVNHPQRRAGRTFTDDTGKVRKKGGFLPNFVTDNALVRRVRNRPIDVTKAQGQATTILPTFVMKYIVGDNLQIFHFQKWD
jgi:hypothetical protein